MDYLASSSVDAARWYWLVDKLSEAAKKRAMINVEIDRTTLVASDTVNMFVKHYAQAIPGKTYVCYGKSGCGKTMAAAHLLHNSYDKDCPKRAIMVNAGGSKDFPTDFCLQQNAANATPHLVDILCTSLIFQEKKDAANNFGSMVRKIWSDFCRLGAGCFAPTVDEPRICLQDSSRLIQIGRGREISSRYDLPILIIDDLPESEANERFVSRLYTRAYALKISVLILTKDDQWATKIKDINGGVKILPVDGAIENPRGNSVEPFTGEPRWNGMGWNLADLQLFAISLGHPDISADLRDGMTPDAVVDLHLQHKF